MYFLLNAIKRQKNSEEGFVLVVAIMAIIVMVAVGFFAMTMISGDLVITSRLASERRAFSAAESGVHAILTSLDFDNLASANVSNVRVSANDPTLVYSARTQATERQIFIPGYDLASKARIHEAVVTGRNTQDGSSVTLSVGVAGPPAIADTQQGKL